MLKQSFREILTYFRVKKAKRIRDRKDIVLLEKWREILFLKEEPTVKDLPGKIRLCSNKKIDLSDKIKMEMDCIIQNLIKARFKIDPLDAMDLLQMYTQYIMIFQRKGMYKFNLELFEQQLRFLFEMEDRTGKRLIERDFINSIVPFILKSGIVVKFAKYLEEIQDCDMYVIVKNKFLRSKLSGINYSLRQLNAVNQ